MPNILAFIAIDKKAKIYCLIFRTNRQENLVQKVILKIKLS